MAVPFLSEGEITKPFGANIPQEKKPADTGKMNIESNSTKPTTQQGGEYPEQDIAKLTGLGFSRTQAIQALKVCQGNVDMAAAFLFQ